jgi:hypothetical protein
MTCKRFKGKQLCSCSKGSFKTPDDLKCSTDLDKVCPHGTYLQEDPPLCIDCNCGLCDIKAISCCNNHIVGDRCYSKKALISDQDSCDLKRFNPCTYNPADQYKLTDNERCFVCSVESLVKQESKCSKCYTCLEALIDKLNKEFELKKCGFIGKSASKSEEDWKACLKDLDRVAVNPLESCSASCLKEI